MRLAILTLCIGMLGVGDATQAGPIDRQPEPWCSTYLGTTERAVRVKGGTVALVHEYDIYDCGDGVTRRVWTGR